MSIIFPKTRPIPIAWREAPLDMRAVGFKAMLVLHVPVRKEWTQDQRNKVAQKAADAALAAVQHEEDR